MPLIERRFGWHPASCTCGKCTRRRLSEGGLADHPSRTGIVAYVVATIVVAVAVAGGLVVLGPEEPARSDRAERIEAPAAVIQAAAARRAFTLPQHLAQVEWSWDSHEGFESVLIDLATRGNPIPPLGDPEQGFYLGALFGSIDGTNFYFGLQTRLGESPDIEPQRGVIFSRWGTLDKAHTRVGEGGWRVAASYEGDFISIRFPYAWGTGGYQMELRAEAARADGRWFALYITDLEDGRTTWAGSLRFTGMSIRQPLITWMEIYGPGAIEVQDLPEFTVAMSLPRADGELQPTGIYPAYWDSDKGSDIRINGASPAVEFAIGPNVKRTLD